MKTVALALGGGGARGLAHIAVMETLDEMGIRPVAIAGTSIGALLGAPYAAGMSGKDTIRAIEEQGAAYETFGVAGFFGVAIDYQGLYDHSPAAHCPVVVIPAHEVHEAPADGAHGWHERRSRWRDRWNAPRCDPNAASP